MPAPTLRMNPARERRMWLALVASAGASLTVGMSAREKSMTSGARIAQRRAGRCPASLEDDVQRRVVVAGLRGLGRHLTGERRAVERRREGGEVARRMGD